MTHTHCPECGFHNPEAANFCSKCGALLIRDDAGAPDDELRARRGDGRRRRYARRIRIEGTALVVRSGGGRAGETFAVADDRVMIGRSPECEIFLDDVTVSRRHALVAGAMTAARSRTWEPERHLRQPSRVEKAQLEDGDEVQIGKYRLTFLDH